MVDDTETKAVATAGGTRKLVLCNTYIAVYSFFSLIRAAAVVKRQSIPVFLPALLHFR
jgi:hypothetical protein